MRPMATSILNSKGSFPEFHIGCVAPILYRIYDQSSLIQALVNRSGPFSLKAGPRLPLEVNENIY